MFVYFLIFIFGFIVGNISMFIVGALLDVEDDEKHDQLERCVALLITGERCTYDCDHKGPHMTYVDRDTTSPQQYFWKD